LEEKCKALELEHEQKDEELNNLSARAKELEETLEAAEVNLKQATTE